MSDTKALMSYEFGNLSVRAEMIDGEPWFVAKDVCDALCYSNSRDAISKLDDDERELVRVDTLGGSQNMTIINESGLYSLILRSNKPEAKVFKRWVTKEVLPSIRKTGGYQTSIPTPNQDAFMLPVLYGMIERLTKRVTILESHQGMGTTQSFVRRFTQEEDEKLLSLRDLNVRESEIARILNRNYASVYTRLKLLDSKKAKTTADGVTK
jgi:prophage antirepressor-like protein